MNALYQAKLLADHLRAMGYGDDDELLADSIEGETDALRSVDRLLAEIGEAEQNQAVLKLREDEMADRRARFGKRSESLRKALLSWMEDCGLKKLERPEATLSVRPGGAGVAYTADFGADLPDEFVKITRTPDKAAVRKAVLAGETVIGAEISNSPSSLQIRRS